MPAGQYLVTGDREITSVLTVHPASADGQQRWELADGATLYDVTHLRCRSARLHAGEGGRLVLTHGGARGRLPGVSRRGHAAGRRLRQAGLPSADRDRRAQERLSE